MEMSEDQNLICGENEMFHGRTNGLKMYQSEEKMTEEKHLGRIQDIDAGRMCKSVESYLSEKG